MTYMLDMSCMFFMFEGRLYGQMKSRDGKSQIRKPEQKVREENKKKIKEEKDRRKKMQVHEKVGKSRNTVFF